MAGYKIELKNVSLTLENYTILDNVSCIFEAGKSTVVLGPSGCGKSTLLKIAALIVVPDEGEIFYNNKNIKSLSEKEISDIRRNSGFAFQNSALWVNMSLYDNLLIPLSYHNPELNLDQINERIQSVIKPLDFRNPLSLRPDQLSQGEKKMLSFARALINNPSLVFLDDPTLAVDHHNALQIRHIVSELKRDLNTIISITHDSEWASLISDNLIVMDFSKILAAGSFSDIIHHQDRQIQNILSGLRGEITAYDDDILNMLRQD